LGSFWGSHINIAYITPPKEPKRGQNNPEKQRKEILKHPLSLLSSYDYALPKELIAVAPVVPRDASRLLIVERASGKIQETLFRTFFDTLHEGDSLVFNNTKVIPARLKGRKESGGEVELFLLEPKGEGKWEVLARPAKKVKQGSGITFSDALSCRVVSEVGEGKKLVQFIFQGQFFDHLAQVGTVPLPPYMERQSRAQDIIDYQTVFAEREGAVAAPTAGLHFTEELLGDLESRKVQKTMVTLHVGLGTFQPVRSEVIHEHTMHRERLEILPQAAELLNCPVSVGHKRIVVGTTCCRALESAALPDGKVVPGAYTTDLFITPGYSFKYMQSPGIALLTNFHQPRSTLLMLTAAFTGYDLLMEAYREAIERRFRFFSYGDAMLII